MPILFDLIPDEENPGGQLLRMWAHTPEFLFEQDYPVRALIKMGSVALPRLRAVLMDREESNRWVASYILSRMDPTAEAVVPDLLEILKDRHPGKEPWADERQKMSHTVVFNSLENIAPDVAKANLQLDPFTPQ